MPNLMFLFLFLFGIEKAQGLKCYSCGDENVFLGERYSGPHSCEDLDKSVNLEPFIIECPEEYLGCMTQSTGKSIIRTCDTLAIDDCETANGITYCYCSQDLCNGKESHTDAHKSSRDVMINYPSDDEDYTDMSGLGKPTEDEGDYTDIRNVVDSIDHKNSSSQILHKIEILFMVHHHSLKHISVPIVLKN